MSVRRHGHALIAGASILPIGLILGSCDDSRSGTAGERDDQNHQVVVLTGMHVGGDMQIGNDPLVLYNAASEQVVYVSGALYSSTCPPIAKATVNGPIVALEIEDADGNCTADAVRDTFKIGGVTNAPMWLVVRQTGQPKLRVAVNAR